MLYRAGLFLTVVLNSFWFVGYPAYFRYPLWLFWAFFLSAILFISSINEYRFKYINIFKYVVYLTAYSMLYGVYSSIFLLTLLMTSLSIYIILIKSKIETLHYISFVNIIMLSALLFYYFILENSWISSVYFSLEPSNFAFTALFFGQLLFLSNHKLLRYSGFIFISISLFIYPSKTLFLGSLVFFVSYYFINLNTLMLRFYSLICFILPIIIIIFSDLLNFYLIMLLDDGSSYAYLKGWLIATDIFQNNFFGKGFIPSDSLYYIPQDNTIVENLNNRDLASLNPFLLASHGIFYFLFFGLFIFKKVNIGNYGPILLSYLIMYFIRWSGFYNSTFILALVFFIVYNNREILTNNMPPNKIKTYDFK
jgi:hypothetical protein